MIVMIIIILITKDSVLLILQWQKTLKSFSLSVCVRFPLDFRCICFFIYNNNNNNNNSNNNIVSKMTPMHNHTCQQQERTPDTQQTSQPSANSKVPEHLADQPVHTDCNRNSWRMEQPSKRIHQRTWKTYHHCHRRSKVDKLYLPASLSGNSERQHSVFYWVIRHRLRLNNNSNNSNDTDDNNINYQRQCPFDTTMTEATKRVSRFPFSFDFRSIFDVFFLVCFIIIILLFFYPRQ